MGDSRTDPLRVEFDRQIKLEFHGSTVSSDAGLLAYRELDDALGLTTTAATGLHDSRTGKNTQHGIARSPARKNCGRGATAATSAVLPIATRFPPSRSK